jgi:transcriptional regulator with XRE-family HTH domain
MPPGTPVDPNLARVLRAAREKQGRSQEAVAHDAGLTVTALARIERAQANPTWTTVLQILGALGLSLQQLADLLPRAADDHIVQAE